MWSILFSPVKSTNYQEYFNILSINFLDMYLTTFSGWLQGRYKPVI